MEEMDTPRNDVNTSAELDDEIRSTDIVFECPFCSHGLVIDYKGAGLHVTCPECGNEVLAPIPEGMRISDLDLQPGELLRQLFAARRQLLNAERKIAEQEVALAEFASMQASIAEEQAACAQKKAMVEDCLNNLRALLSAEDETITSIRSILNITPDQPADI